MNPDMDAPNAVETRGLSKTYRGFWGRARVHALVDLDLTVPRGEVFGLLGPNGSGKTTTLKLLLGLLFPTRGKALVLGQAADDVAVKRRIGFLPEESYLYRFLNAEETLDFYGRLFGMSRRDRRRSADELIDLVGIGHARRRPLREYSKGMARRLGLAQALLNDPELIFLDEPTSGLDPIGSREVKDLILELKRRGKTIVLCSHLLGDVENVCDRIAMLVNGRLCSVGGVKELLTLPGQVELTIRNLPPEALDQVVQSIERAGGEVLSVHPPTQTLESLFLKVIGEHRHESHLGHRAEHNS